MAQKVILVDDLDGSEHDVTTIQLSVDGDTYEIDLSPSNLARLRQAVQPFTVAGRRVGTRKSPTSMGRSRAAKDVAAGKRDGRAARMRAWAKDNGYDLPAFGRIPNEVVEAYHEAHGREICTGAGLGRVS
jgi:Lsr2